MSDPIYDPIDEQPAKPTWRINKKNGINWVQCLICNPDGLGSPESIVISRDPSRSTHHCGPGLCGERDYAKSKQA